MVGMTAIAFVISFVLFLGGIYLFGIAFDVAEAWQLATFAGGLIAVTVGVMIPVHVLKRVDDL